MTQPAERTFKKNEIVGHIARPGRWRVERVLKVNIEIRALDGQMPALVRAKPYSLTDPPEQTPAGEVTTVDIPTYFEHGQIVTSYIPKIAGRLFVVFKDDGGNLVNAHDLFGNSDKPGQYWRLPRPTISLVTPSELVRTLLLRVSNISVVGDDERTQLKAVRELLADDMIAATLKNGNGS